MKEWSVTLQTGLTQRTVIVRATTRNGARATASELINWPGATLVQIHLHEQ